MLAGVMDGATADTSATVHAMFAALQHDFPDLRATPQLLLVAGRSVFVQSVVAGTDAKTHRAIGVYAVEQLTFDDSDRIIKDDVYVDPTAVMGQRGALPEGVEVRPVVQAASAGAPEVLVAASNALETANATVVRDWEAAINAHDLDRALSFVGDDPVDSDAGIPADLRGKKAVTQLYTHVLRDIPDYHRDVPNVYAIGKYVVAPGIKTGTWSGSPVRLHYLELIEVQGGKLVSVRRFYNTFAMAEQIERGAH